MTSFDALPALAIEQDWLIDTRAPDWFGDVRVSMLSAAGSVVLLVFDKTGKFAGGYLTERCGKMFHTERVRDVETWLVSMNGVIE